jgi:hypothetical protein
MERYALERGGDLALALDGGLAVVEVVQADARGAQVGRTRAVLVNVRDEDLAVGEQATAA